VQYPGVLINWAPLIQGVHGIGKSFIGKLITTLLGLKNVGKVSPVSVSSNFNGYATGACVNILEEISVKGHNRYDVMNGLKPLITDTEIQINDKGVKTYTTQNTTNYILFTNDKNAIPVEDTDRRYWIVCRKFLAPD
jgi:phage/plasmid-associated DNA primase